MVKPAAAMERSRVTGRGVPRNRPVDYTAFMPRLRPILWPLVLACTSWACSDGVPESCHSMCEAASLLQATCLAADGLDWSQSRWQSQADFDEACLTWAWEAQKLEGAAARQGEAERGSIIDACEQRGAEYAGSQAQCEPLDGPGWALPWETE